MFALSAIMLALYNIVLWRPEPIYNNILMFICFLLAQLTFDCVHISKFFITFERILIMRSANPAYNQKLLLGLCIFFNIAVTIYTAIFFIIRFIQVGMSDESCLLISCMIGMDTYLVSYHVSNAISACNLIASVYFLFLFRKTTITVDTHGKQAAKMENMIKFTIYVDFCLDLFPQIVTVVLSLIGSVIGSYIGTLQRVLFSFCGIFVNQRFYNVFVTHERSFTVKSTTVAIKAQSKVKEMPDLYKFALLIATVIVFIVYSYVAYLTSRLLWYFVLRQQKASVQIVPILTAHVASWWLSAVTAVLLTIYSLAYWRPEPIYDKTVMFCFILPSLLTLNCVHISRFFITLERIIIMNAIHL
uniref:G protein-coupled receptor n=1 Tax=Panagrellus redivivus TaxID=6233 RepID=A0A7E4ZPY4_PANRE